MDRPINNPDLSQASADLGALVIEAAGQVSSDLVPQTCPLSV